VSDCISSLFPHSQHTKIIGKHTNTLLQVLKQQLYNNASSVSSRCSGSAHEFLGVALDPMQYLLVSNNITWTNPVHSGDMPIHVQGLTSVLCKQVNHQYDSNLAAYELYNRTSNALRQELILAVHPSFLWTLEHPTYRFMMITPLAIIQHRDAIYTTSAPEERETNRLEFAKLWNPDSPLEDLWARVDNIRCPATNGDAPISKVTTSTLLLAIFKMSGSLRSTTKKFRLINPAGWTLAAFQGDINHCMLSIPVSSPQVLLDIMHHIQPLFFPQHINQ
jgi:hypothetical protein